MLNKGDKIGEYILLNKVGSGGFGDVWKAEKRTNLDVNYFALKFFRPKDDRIDFDNIGKELAVWKQLRGLGNIISVIELDRFDDYVYVVSDFAEGGSLESWLKANGKASSEVEAVKITLEILTGLENLHDKGFVHRDLKPDNVLIMNGKFCLADFGISREVKSQSKATGTAGTVEYMPPEAFDDKVSIHTDIWAVGVILQKLLTGKLPFERDNQAALIGAILMAEPEGMPEIVPEDLREIVKKALRKDREQRFQTAREMREALKNPQGFLETIKAKTVPTSTIIDEDFDKEQLKIEQEKQRQAEQARLQHEREEQQRQQELIEQNRLKQLREAEAEKERQRQLAEAQRRQAEEEAKRLATIEAKRRQAELAELQRKLEAQKSKQSSSNLWNWLMGGVSGAVVLILGIIGFNSLPNNNSTVGNSPNKPANFATNKPAANTSSKPSNSDTFKNSIGMEFVKIPSGSFMMGSPTTEKDRSDNETQHRVTISRDFYLGKYEVTQAQWKALMGSNPSNFKGDNLPVEQVTWDDAQEFIKKLNAKGEGTYRLPTEAEWEYSARGGKDGDVFGIGDGKNLSSEQANFDGNYPYGNATKGKYLEKTVAVGSYQPNKFGLYDMHGNVWEWCADWYGAYPSGSVTDPVGATSGSVRVYRGGGWIYNGWGLRSANRGVYSPTVRLSFLGFRLIRAE